MFFVYYEWVEVVLLVVFCVLRVRSCGFADDFLYITVVVVWYDGVFYVWDESFLRVKGGFLIDE